MEKKKILVIGLGRMGSAIARGLHNHSDKVTVYGDTTHNATSIIEEIGILHYDLKKNDNKITDFDYVFICTRNEDQAELCHTLDEANDFANTKTVLVSMASGVTYGTVKSYFTRSKPWLLRIMPNIFVAWNEATILIARETEPTKEEYELMSYLGTVFIVPEEKFSEATILSSSSPAFFLYFIRIFDEWAQSIRFFDNPRGIIFDVVASTGKFLTEHDVDLTEYINRVCTPGGVSVQAIEHWDEVDIATKIKDGLTKSLNKDKWNE